MATAAAAFRNNNGNSNGRNDDDNNAQQLLLFDASALQQALASNRSLQAVLLSELERIAAKKAANRARAADCLLYCARHQQQLQKKAEPFVSTITDSSGASGAAAVLDSRRKWTRRFFVDVRKGSCSTVINNNNNNDEPALNADTVKRRAMEDASSFFFHLQPPWSKKESKDLMEAVTSVTAVAATSTDENHAAVASTTTSEPSQIDFQKVATILVRNRQAGENARSRTPDECRIHHQLQQQRQKSAPFSKRELQTLSENVAAAATLDADWGAIAELLSTEHQQRTAWDCLVAYHTKVVNKKSSSQQTASSSSAYYSTTPWTALEDELLLKFLAAAGPQTVVESKNALIQCTILNQLLHANKSKKQIFTRANQSLLNPSLRRSEWSENEERRLPIFMKIYAAANEPSSSQSSSQDLFLAAAHCHGRSTKSVVDKWNRSINPEYSSRPFTPHDDEALMQVMRSTLTSAATTNAAANATDAGSSNNNNNTTTGPIGIGWTELSQKHFPDRHPQRLQSRWSELASDQDILDRERALHNTLVTAEKEAAVATAAVGRRGLLPAVRTTKRKRTQQAAAAAAAGIEEEE